MKKSKKFLSVIMSVTMTLGSVWGMATYGAARPEEPMTEDLGAFVQVSDWAEAEIEEAFEKDLIPAVLETEDLRENINRAEFAAVAVQLYEAVSGDKTVYNENPFVDVDNSNFAINKAYHLGITTGTTETTFEPDALISREQLATMLCRVFKKYAWNDWSIDKDGEFYLNYEIEAPGFSDHDEISEYALSSVYFMKYHAIINGVGDDMFAPKPMGDVGYATREQSILMALRSFDNLFEDEIVNNSRADVSSYEGVYREYVKDSIMKHNAGDGDFSQGIFICDLNEDGVPELFSVAYGAERYEVRYHQYKDGKMVGDSVPVTLIDMDIIAKPTTYFEDSRHFMGVYRNKKTGQLAIINSIAEGSEKDRFDIVTYDGSTMTVQDKGIKEINGNSWNIDEIRAEVMKDYEVVDDALPGSILLRGYFAMYSIPAALEMIDEAVADFKSKDELLYTETKNGKVEGFVRNVDLETGMIDIIPALTITYEQYTAAMNSDSLVELNGTLFKIQHDENLYENMGQCILFELPGYEYYFEQPTQEYPVSVVKGYRDCTPMKVKLGENVEFISEASGEVIPMDVAEFFDSYAVNYNGNYYSFTIENNEIVDMTLLYRP